MLYRLTSNISHHRSNTVPSRGRKFNAANKVNQQVENLSPTYKSHVTTQQQTLPSQAFSPSLLKDQPRRRIRAIDDPDEVESLSSVINRIT